MTTTTLNNTQLRFARSALDYSVEVFEDTIGSQPVIRTDLGLVIAYQSTDTYAIECRGNGKDSFAYRVDNFWYFAAEDIPAEYRKARTVASRFEKFDLGELLERQSTFEQARNEN